MSEPAVADKLVEYGLTERESKVYIHVAKRGPCPAGEIARALFIRRGQTYNILKALQEKGLVEAVAGRPIKFSAISLPKAIDVLLEAHKQKERLMEKIKPELLSMWQSALIARTEEVEEEKFQFLKGIEGIYRKALEIIDEGKSNLTMIASEPALFHVDRLGVLEKMREVTRRDMEVRVLAEVTPRVREIVEHMGKIGTKSFDDYPSPHFLIVNGKEMLFLTRPLESVDPRDATAIWTNSPMLIKTMQHLFESVWSSGRWASEVLATVEPRARGKVPVQEKSRGAKALQERFAKYLAASGFDVRKDHMVVGSSGVEHIFSLALFRNGGKPVVIDIESSEKPISPIQVIRFFAKKLDIKGRVTDTTLIVEPNLDRDARRLATFYRIKFTELSSIIGTEWSTTRLDPSRLATETPLK